MTSQCGKCGYSDCMCFAFKLYKIVSNDYESQGKKHPIPMTGWPWEQKRDEGFDEERLPMIVKIEQRDYLMHHNTTPHLEYNE